MNDVNTQDDWQNEIVNLGTVVRGRAKDILRFQAALKMQSNLKLVYEKVSVGYLYINAEKNEAVHAEE